MDASASSSVSSSVSSDAVLCSQSAVLPAAALSSPDYGAVSAATNRGNILLCGWPGNSFSMELILALDRKIGMETGADDTRDPARILILNQHDAKKIDDVLTSLRPRMRHSVVEHINCDPRQRHELERVLPREELLTFKGALTLVDIDWFRDEASADERSADFFITPASTLKMDALILTCHLNLRHMLRDCGDDRSCPGSETMILISEKLSTNETRVTRFEDRTRLPLGSSVNSSSFAAKVLAQEAILPGSMKIYNKVDDVCRLVVVDTSLLAEPGEEVSYADLQGRAADMQSTLLGFYGELDGERDTYVALNLNPQGGETKREKRVWNKVGTSGGRTCLVLAAGKDLHRVIIKTDL